VNTYTIFGVSWESGDPRNHSREVKLWSFEALSNDRAVKIAQDWRTCNPGQAEQFDCLVVSKVVHEHVVRIPIKDAVVSVR